MQTTTSSKTLVTMLIILVTGVINFCVAQDWKRTLPSIEAYSDFSEPDIQTMESDDGTLWRLITPPIWNQSYAYLERFDPESGLLKNSSTYTYRITTQATRAEYAKLTPASNGEAYFAHLNFSRILKPDLHQKSNAHATIISSNYIPKFTYTNFPDRTDVHRADNGEFVLSIAIPTKYRIPDIQYSYANSTNVFVGQAFETKNGSLIVWLKSFRKIDGSEVWRKRFEFTREIFGTEDPLYRHVSFYVHADEDTLVFSVGSNRYRKSFGAAAVLDPNGTILWQREKSISTAISGTLFDVSPTRNGNIIFSDKSTSSGNKLLTRNGVEIRTLTSGKGFISLPNGNLLRGSNEEFQLENELTGEVIWTTPLNESFHPEMVCAEDTTAFFILTNLTGVSKIGRIDLNTGAVLLNAPPVQNGYSAWTQVSLGNLGLGLVPCLNRPQFAQRYDSSNYSFAIGLDENANTLWKLDLTPSYMVRYLLKLKQHIRDSYSWCVFNNCILFSGSLDQRGNIKTGYTAYYNQYESNFVRVTSLLRHDDGTQLEIREERTDLDTSYLVAVLPPVESRPLLDLQAAEVDTTNVGQGQIRYRFRVKNLNGTSVRGSRVVGFFYSATYRCFPSNGAACRFGDGNRLLNAEVDLPSQEAFVDFEVVADQFNNQTGVMIAPSLDDVEFNIFNNFVSLRPDFRHGFEY